MKREDAAVLALTKGGRLELPGGEIINDAQDRHQQVGRIASGKVGFGEAQKQLLSAIEVLAAASAAETTRAMTPQERALLQAVRAATDAMASLAGALAAEAGAERRAGMTIAAAVRDLAAAITKEEARGEDQDLAAAIKALPAALAAIKPNVQIIEHEPRPVQINAPAVVAAPQVQRPTGKTLKLKAKINRNQFGVPTDLDITMES